MLRSYALTARRYLLKNRIFSLINIGGLIIGMAACLLIALYVQNETSYDRHWQNSEAVYRINQRMTFPNAVEEVALTSLRLLPALQQYFGQQIEGGSRIGLMSGQIRIGDRAHFEKINLVDSGLPSIFQMQLIAGDIQDVLTDTSSIALSKASAERYFGTESPIGRIVTFQTANAAPVEYRVGAVYQLAPGNTTLNLENFVLLDYAKFEAREAWLFISADTYVKLHPSLTTAEFSSQLPEFVDRSVNLPPEVLAPGQSPSEVLHYYPQALHEIYFNPVARPNFPAATFGDKNMVAVFAMISVLILLMGIANFVILSTARASQRAREVGVRKVSGASRAQVVMQFVGESLFFTTLALAGAMTLVELLLPLFATMTGKQLAIAYDSSSTWVAVGGLLLLVGMTGGFYPAYVLSSQPSGTLQLLRKQAGVGLRNFLMVLQFSILIGLVIATAVVYGQLLHLGKIKPGFNPDELLIVENVDSGEINAAKNVFRQELLALPGVTNAAYSSNQPNNVGNGGIDVGLYRTRGSTGPGFGVASLSIGTDFFDTYQIPLLSGRSFIEGRDPEQRRRNRLTPLERERYQREEKHVMLNESAARAFGFDPPATAADQYIQPAEGDGEFRDVLVIGVVADSQFIDLRAKPVAEVYQFFPEATRFMAIRYVDGQWPGILESVGQIWSRHMGDTLFTFSFVEQNLRQVFARERNEGRILATFTLLALSIACLGLFGSAAFSVACRTREIGMRKVMGARVMQVVSLLLWQFSRPVLLANLLAWPLAIWAMLRWLQRFPYQMELWMLVPTCLLSGLVALCIAWIAVGSTAAKAASQKPVLALRYE